MKAITSIAIILAASSLTAYSADAVLFVEAEPKREIDFRVSLHLKVGEKLYIKLAKGFLVMSVDDIRFKSNNDSSAESCVITTTHIENDRVTKSSRTSSIVYSIEMKDGNEDLSVVDGSQDFRKAGIEFSWSYASKDAVYLYVPPKTKYAITGAKQ
ncbi:hypothetical protein HW115_19085 [Verrucomicrobiaceae bacterium N1E253]|uniref:Uncharacterized protein n=1 Tax=Oceaniferula marina TaxID=2748318 RepID=A0A851GPB1_9BACT|nr:hypothetical protein [Oceaniferula marina]NWK57731.1 hypothetical protein [Oceaniferula marina]